LTALRECYIQAVVGTLAPLIVGDREFRWGSRTYVMGILNVTPDSFSGDGVTSVTAAVQRGLEIEAEGADLLDIGGESTRPETWGGPGLPADEEMARVLPVIAGLRGRLSIPISVDTYKASVAAAALEAGASLVNDVWGLRRDPEMAGVAARRGAPVVVMHNQERPRYQDLLADVARALRESIALAVAAGIPRERIICDPGIGFGKTTEQNLRLLRRLGELRNLGQPILVGPSRKSFIAKVLGSAGDDRREGTAAVVALAVAGGADLVRVHDVRAMVRVARVADAVVRAGP